MTPADGGAAGVCSLGVGCEQYGVCYAAANGKPEQCGKADDLADFVEWLEKQRSVPTMDPPWSAAWNACIDHVKRHVIAMLAERAK